MRCISRKPKSDPATQRISKIVCFPNAQIIQHRQYVRGAMSDVVSGGIVRLVTLAVSSCIEKDQLMVLLRSIWYRQALVPVRPCIALYFEVVSNNLAVEGVQRWRGQLYISPGPRHTGRSAALSFWQCPPENRGTAACGMAAAPRTHYREFWGPLGTGVPPGSSS